MLRNEIKARKVKCFQELGVAADAKPFGSAYKMVMSHGQLPLAARLHTVHPVPIAAATYLAGYRGRRCRSFQQKPLFPMVLATKHYTPWRQLTQAFSPRCATRVSLNVPYPETRSTRFSPAPIRTCSALCLSFVACFLIPLKLSLIYSAATL